MKKVFLPIVLIFALSASAQKPSSQYHALIAKADSLYQNKAYRDAAAAYTKAFEVNQWKGFIPDLYGAAKAWAMTGNLDSAFRKLDRVISYARHEDFKNYKDFVNEPAFQSLHHDDRWKKLLARANEKYNNPLILQLDTILQDDQKYRSMVDSVFKNYGWDSPEGRAFNQKVRKVDSINVIKVKEIIKTYGWPGKEEVGQMGNMAIFLVIQHADSATQVEHLPIMRKAVKEGKAEASQLALLEDRVALKQGKKQIYGSQIGTNTETGKPFLLPLIDPDNVDKRRKEVGLPPLAEYVKQWGINWDVEEYKRGTN
jgi:tetratricopeptide (TPR) repeat protein